LKLPVPERIMLATIDEPSMLLMYLVMCTFPQGCTVLFALPALIRNQQCVHSAVECEPEDSHLCFKSHHLLIIQHLGIRNIWLALSCSIVLASDYMACSILIVVEYGISAPCRSNTVLFSRSSDAPESSHIIW
jgi:membrane-anchored glycerophosphoryl diester phosphodiesterase (GDPDase)